MSYVTAARLVTAQIPAPAVAARRCRAADRSGKGAVAWFQRFGFVRAGQPERLTVPLAFGDVAPTDDGADLGDAAGDAIG